MDVYTSFWNGERKFYLKCKNSVLADLLGSQYLFEILQTSLTVKNSESIVKRGCFEKCLRWRAPIFFEMKERYKFSYVKILIFH